MEIEKLVEEYYTKSDPTARIIFEENTDTIEEKWPRFTQEESNRICELILELREQLKFDPKLDYDNGCKWDNPEGWHLAMLVRSPIDCLEQIVSTKTVYKGDAKLER